LIVEKGGSDFAFSTGFTRGYSDLASSMQKSKCSQLRSSEILIENKSTKQIKAP